MQSLGLIDALLVVLIGMVIVFFGLVVLIALIKLLVSVTTGRKAQKAPLPVPPPPRPAPAFPAPAPAAEETDDAALVAAITAALAIVLEGSDGFRVRRIRRIQNTPAWQRAGREEQIYSRF